MARPFFPNEADDPDLDWLVSNFLYERPDYLPVETGMLPLVLIPFKDVGGASKLPKTQPETQPAEESDS